MNEKPVTLITGAASGMGRLAAQRYARSGETVVGIDLNQQGLTDTALGFSNMHTFQLDITNWKDVESTINLIEQSIGPIQKLINCAGIMPLGTLISQDVDLIHKIMDVNYKGTVNTNKAVLAHMSKRNSGNIANFASIAGWVPGIGFGAYNAAKFAVVAFSEALHHENKHTGINVCCVCPPPVNTPLLKSSKNRSKVLDLAPPVEPEFVINAMEKQMTKGKPFCFPGTSNYLAWWFRRLFPNMLWHGVHLVEGKDLSGLSANRDT